MKNKTFKNQPASCDRTKGPVSWIVVTTQGLTWLPLCSIISVLEILLNRMLNKILCLCLRIWLKT